MSKFCCVCGREIITDLPYYCEGYNTFTCSNECHDVHRWDVLAARFNVEGQHTYFVVNNHLYEIGDEKDEPHGMSGRYYVIQFDDGTMRDTHSLWFIADVPKSKRKIFKQNARFIQKGECGYYA